VLAAFTQAYPGITLAVEIANSGRVVAGVLNQAWDLGVVSGTPDQAQLQVQPYCRDTLIPIVPPSHRLAAQPAATLADLVGETRILRAVGSASGQVVERVLQAHHALHGHTLRLQGCEEVRQAVIAGLGIGMVSRYAITREVQHGVLRVLPISDFQVERELTLIWRKGVRLPATAVAILDMLGPTGLHVR
jgi:DNA-binding transcriptional LysR family regulator